MKQERLKTWLQTEAQKLGFDAMAVTPAVLRESTANQLRQAISLNHHGTMDWMVETLERRSNPKTLWPEARSAILLAMNYAPKHDPLATIARPYKGNISVYARNRDYHDVIKGRLKVLAGKLASKLPCQVKVFVDTAPLMEKPLAESAGLGWQGKHTNLVSRQFGSWLFIGSILTDLELGEDNNEVDHCGNCTACLDACPTNAFPAPYQLDGRRCISYLTIEHRGQIAREFRKPMGNRIYGCDDCLAVCPWNKFAQAAKEQKLVARNDLVEPDIARLLTLDDAAFRTFFSGSPVKRIGRNRFIRNVLVAAGNSGKQELLPEVNTHLQDEDPLVRGMAVWAFAQLADAEEFATKKEHALETENNLLVIEEWKQ